MNKKLFFLFIVLLPLYINAQFVLKINATRTTDSIAYFRGTIFDENNYLSKDTLKLFKGNAVSINKKSIIGGIYYLQFPSTQQRIYFVLENKDTMTISLSGKNPLDSIHSSKYKNEIFFEYQRLEARYADQDSIFSNIEKNKKQSLAQKKAFFKAKNDTLFAFRKKALLQLKPNEVLYLHFNYLNLLQTYLPERKNIQTRTDFINQFNWKEPRLLFSNDIKEILYAYLSAYPLHADSLRKGMDTVLSKVDCKSKSYPYIFDYFTKIIRNRSIENNTTGFTSLIDQYILNGKCQNTDSTKLRSYLSLYNQTISLSKKDTCVNMVLKDTSDNLIDLYEFAKNFDVTVIIFYDPNCDHCKIEVPELDKTISAIENAYKIRIGKYAICNSMIDEQNDWKYFINKYHLDKNYANVKLSFDSNLRSDYDAYSNPVFHLINKDGIFLSKKTSAITLKKYFK